MVKESWYKGHVGHDVKQFVVLVGVERWPAATEGTRSAWCGTIRKFTCFAMMMNVTGCSSLVLPVSVTQCVFE
jgi:hypothetical protein